MRAERVLWRSVPAGVVVLPLSAEEPLLLSGSGASLWALLSEPVALRDLSEILAADFGVAPDLVADAIQPVVEELDRSGVVDEVT